MKNPFSAAKRVCLLERPGGFSFSIPTGDAISCGDYVLLTADNRVYFGQVDRTSLDLSYVHSSGGLSIAGISVKQSIVTPAGYYIGGGQILAQASGGGLDMEFDRYGCAGEASIELAGHDAIAAYFDAAYADTTPLLTVGTLLNDKEPLRVRLIPKGLQRHLGVFGQSGSGKSFALALLLEELHFWTSCDVVVLDANGDFSGFRDDLRPLDKVNHSSNKHAIEQAEYEQYVARHAARADSVHILSIDSSGSSIPIGIRLSDLKPSEQAVLLRLDPVADRDEYHALTEAVTNLAAEKSIYTFNDFIDYCRAWPRVDSVNLLARIDNLRLEDLRVWHDPAAGVPSLSEHLLREDRHTSIIDLSSAIPLERTLVATVVFQQLWQKQMDRKRDDIEKQCLLVADEAHNLFGNNARSPDSFLTLDWGSRIAGEGRKFGLYLCVSTQLPSKVHPHVLTQCGNLILMKMMSQSDLDALRDSFSFVSEPLLHMSRSFTKGQALIIGGVVPAPCLVHFEGRKTQEGGKDLEAGWA